MESSKLLINEPPLQVLPTLARSLDVNKAIILQQIQYWIATSGHEINGERWVYNSYSEWSRQFPWLSSRAIRWHIKGLEETGLLISGEFNKDPRDNTKWYRIDYEKLNQLVTVTSPGMAKSVTPPVNERPVQRTSIDTALPENTTENTTREKKAYGEFENVFLTDVEKTKLVERFGVKAVQEEIEKLSCGIESRGYKYKSHYAAILNWNRRDIGKEKDGAHRTSDEKGGAERLRASVGRAL